ncbi:hypothetical protein F4677DRAFT_418800 [Hypoxylon crocopeplum]|nr:hypothetical protein F4677DRAFT_418800 [Hypoxylon crocopeplum]
MSSSKAPETTNQELAHNVEELTDALDEMLEALMVRFDTVSVEILGMMDEMARRIDRLELSLRSPEEPNPNSTSTP